MEFLRTVRRRSFVSETVYIILNIALAIAILGATIATGTPWLGLALILLSKWRIFAVRPRYWFAHVEANIVDIIVSFGTLTLIYLAGQNQGGGLAVQFVLTALYIVWLLFLKPRSKITYVTAQAGAAVFIGTMALESVSYGWPSSPVVVIMWLIGYSCARHVLVAHSDKDIRPMSLVWGFIFAELGWLTYHWTIAYNLPFAAGLQLPQATLLLLGVSLLAERTYSSYMKHDAIKLNDIILPLILVVSIIIVLMVKFNSASIGSI